MNNNTFPNGRSESSHGCLSYFSNNFQRIDPPRLSEKDYEKKIKSSVIAEFNRAQSAIGHHTMGTSTFRRHLQKLFPHVGICRHKEDYCDTCRSNEIQLKRSSYILRKTKESGNAKEEEVRQLEEQVGAINHDKSQHMTDAKQARDFFNKMTEHCRQDWEAALKYESARHRFTLVLSADY